MKLRTVLRVVTFLPPALAVLEWVRSERAGRRQAPPAGSITPAEATAPTAASPGEAPAVAAGAPPSTPQAKAGAADLAPPAPPSQPATAQLPVAPPVEAPPVEAPPVDVAPVATPLRVAPAVPPLEAAPIDVAPVEPPPVAAMPVDAPTAAPAPIAAPATAGLPLEAPPSQPVELTEPVEAAPVEAEPAADPTTWQQADVRALAPQLSKRAVRLADALAAAPMPVPARRLAAQLGVDPAAVGSHAAALNRTAAATRSHLPEPVQQHGTAAKPRYGLNAAFAAHWPPGQG